MIFVKTLVLLRYLRKVLPWLFCEVMVVRLHNMKLLLLFCICARTLVLAEDEVTGMRPFLSDGNNEGSLETIRATAKLLNLQTRTMSMRCDYHVQNERRSCYYVLRHTKTQKTF